MSGISVSISESTFDSCKRCYADDNPYKLKAIDVGQALIHNCGAPVAGELIGKNGDGFF